MPLYDGTGPRGEGSRTGRGLGYCHPSRTQKLHDMDLTDDEMKTISKTRSILARNGYTAQIVKTGGN